MRIACGSEKGNTRSTNEDRYAVKQIGDSYLLILADGIGGEVGGEIAASIAVDTMIDSFTEVFSGEDSLERISDDELKDKFTSFYRKANYNILIRAVNDKELIGMGTTLTVVLIRGNRLFIAHIGDSRAYLIHGSGIEQLTRDHTYAAELVNSRSITAEEGRNHPGRSVLLKSLGVNAFINPDCYCYNISYGDLVLLCTDGVYSVMEAQEISECVKKHNDLDGCIVNLINKATGNGSRDNITAVLAYVRPEG